MALNKKDYLLFKCPDIPFVRKKIAQFRVNKKKARLLQEELIQQAENNPEKKASIVKEYLQKKEKNIKSLNLKIKDIIKKYFDNISEEDKKTIYEDMLFCYVGYGFLPDEYMFFRLKDKSFEERITYISNAQRMCYFMQMNDTCAGQYFLDKSKNYKFFKKFYKRDALAIEKKSSFEDYKVFIENHPVFVQKCVDLSKGDGVKLINIHETGKSVEEYFELLKETSPYQLEEKISQSEKMNSLNASSVNTIRCNAFVTKHGVVLGFTFLKIGQDGSFVDNGGKGGILVGIDPKTGITNSMGIDEFDHTYEEHPETHVNLKGFQLPDWEGVIRLCKEITPMVKGVKAVGWDLAHTEDGWVIVEGNLYSQFVAQQMTAGKGLKKEFLSIMKDMDLLAK